MSVQPPPTNQGAGFNSAAFPGGSGQTVNFPKAQGTLTLGQGVIWGDGTFQNTASTGGSITVEEVDGTPSVSNVNTIKVSNGTLTDDGSGVVTITTGGGGGGVQNPMTSDLDAGGFSINNADTFSGLFCVVGDVTTPEINNCAAEQYYNLGPVVAGNDYVVGELDPGTDAEASVTIVSRCLDPGVRQTTVFTATAVRTRGHVNCLVNMFEDNPVFQAILICDEGGSSVQIGMRCIASSNTWEIRVYMNQDNKGPVGPYGSYWRFRIPTRILTPVNTFVEMRISQITTSLSGDLEVVQNVNSATMTTGTLVAGASVTTNTVNTNELRDNGLGIVDTFAPLRMNANDIQSAGIIGANAYAAATLGGIVSVGTPSAGPLFVDSGNNRIGINVPAPQEDFEIDGNIQLDSNGANKIKFYDGTATTERAEIDAVASGTGGQLVLYTKEDPGVVTAKMTIQADGRITITNRIEGLPVPVAGTDAANKDYVDASIPSLAGYVQNPMTSALDGGGFAITNILDPVAAQDAATKNYVDSVVPPPGGVTNPMTVDLDGGTFNIFNATSIFAVDNVKSGNLIESYVNIYAGQALGSPLQGFCKVELPQQTGTFTGVMPEWKNGYLKPQTMFSKCSCSESVPSPGANKLNSASLIATSLGAYNLTAPSGLPGTNILIEIPVQLNMHTFSVQVDGEFDGSTIGGNGNSYMYLRDDANTSARIYGMSTGQVVSGARYPLCMNFVGALPAGVYAILLGHYDLGSTRDFTGDFCVRYLGDFGG